MSTKRDESIPFVERVIEATVFRPFEVAAQLATQPDKIVSKRVKQARNDIAAARMIGKFAVDFGIKRLRTEISNQTARSATAPEQPAPERNVEPAAAAASEEPAPAAPDVDTLALPDYDSLAASNIIKMLGHLDAGERDAVAAYERANRHRRTILGKLEQLKDET